MTVSSMKRVLPLLMLLSLALTAGCRENFALISRMNGAEQAIRDIRRETRALRTDLQALQTEQQALREAQLAAPVPAPALAEPPAAAPLIPLTAAPAPTPITPDRPAATPAPKRRRRSVPKKYITLRKKHIRVSVSVSTIQRCLQKARCNPGPVDGVLGKKTISAIETFQRRKGLKADGVVGRRTWARLRRYR